MKKSITYLLLLLLIYAPLSYAQDLNSFFEQSNQFFKAHAQHSNIEYNALHKKPAELDALIAQIATMDLSQATDLSQKAFYINVYNLLIIKNVVQHFPIASPNEVVEFWDEIEFVVANKKHTLQNLKKAIFAQYPDKRLHFALVDGTQSGALVVPFAYMPHQLEETLDNRCIESLNSSKFIQYNKTEEEVTISAIFKLYKNDFQPDVLGFINQYRAQKIDPIAKIKYANYDWRLNSLYGDAAIVINKKSNVVSFSTLAPTINLPKGSVELIWFNGLYAATYGDQNYGSRSSFLSSYLTANYGVTGRLDIGLAFMLRSSRMNDLYSNSPFKVFEFERSIPTANSRNNIYSDWGFSHIGTQVRFAPFKNISLSFEQGVLFPIKGLPTDNTVDESIYLISQIYYMHMFSSRMQLFVAFTYWQGVQSGKEFKFAPPMLRGFLNYFITPRFSIFGTTMYFVEWGAGVKFLITPKFEIQAMYSYYLPIPGLLDLLSPGATSVMTYNMGLRYRF